MNEHMIGEAAGDVWRFLERSGGRSDLNTIRTNIRPKDGPYAELATGWLAREGKVTLEVQHGVVQVGIRR